MKKIGVMITVLTITLFSAETQKGVEALSGETRALLSEEMRHLESGMHRVFTYIIQGEYEEIAKTATDIQNSFILNKSLTGAQRAELQAKIPKAFIELDRTFHATAGKLAEVAEFEDRKGVEENFARMTELCVKCHARYATHRFKLFSE